MLSNFLVEIQESKINGKGCFVVISAKHSTKVIEEGAIKVGTERGSNDVDYTSIDAVVDYMESDNLKGNALVSSNIAVNFFDDSSKEEAFYKSIAKACFWLMDMNINKGLNSALSKIDQLSRMGGNRPYEGFSSFVGTDTNKASHKVIHKVIDDTINKMVNSEDEKNKILERLLSKKDKNARLVELDTTSIEASKRTIEDMIALSLFISPIKTLDMRQTVEWFNENYETKNNGKKISWAKDYQALIVDTGRSIFNAIRESGISTDVENLLAEVDIEKSVSITSKLEKAAHLCSGVELLWMVIAKAEAEAA